MPDRRDHALPHRVLGQLPGPDIDQLFQHLDLDDLVVDGRTRLTLALGSLEYEVGDINQHGDNDIEDRVVPRQDNAKRRCRTDHRWDFSGMSPPGGGAMCRRPLRVSVGQRAT